MKTVVPSYYRKNVAQNAQKKFFRRKALEANREKLRERPVTAPERGEKE